MVEQGASMLSPYRVLDLADEKGIICGKILGDLGADVIKIEKPGGDPARRLGPFYHNELEPEKSLFWFAYNTNKRSITLDIEKNDGKAIFEQLVKKADFVIESFPVGYLDRLGLGYSALEKINPGVILVSITPFGQTGPWKDYKTSDIVAWATGGAMAPFGESDRPPIRISHHSQAYLNAGADGAIGALMALYHRYSTGQGQQIDVSIQEAVIHCLEHITSSWDLRKALMGRGAGGSNEGAAPAAITSHTKRIWPCKDGHVCWFYWCGASMAPRTNGPMAKWMDSEGMANDFLLNYDWTTFDINPPQEDIDRMEAPTGEFILKHTKAELFEGALKYNVQLYPVSTPADMLESVQLSARGFWTKVEHPELNTSITYPRSFPYTSEIPGRVPRRAPLIGEHNDEVYTGELGIARERLLVLKQAGII
jgi:crotonobetainyl-CoA:carnitine CoA-transferase CaiB-like acyl-CoA transferase